MKILIIRLSSIGDIILTTAVLKAFKDKYKDCKIDFLVLDKFKDAISLCPYINKLILYNKSENDGLKGMMSFSKELSKEKYDYVFDLHSKFRSIFIGNFLKYKYGVKVYKYKKRAFWKSILVNLKLIKYKVDNTIIKNYFNAFTDFDIEYKGENLNFSFEENLEKKFLEYKDTIIFAPGASKETKKWTEENFKNLAFKLYNRFQKKIILIGGKEDIGKCDRISENSDGKIINLAGKLSLKESGALLSIAKFLVTNDSGPFHIARGVKCKTFVIFGPTSPEMFEYNKNSILVYKNVDCSPCSLHGDKVCPKKHFNCMKKLDYNLVYNIIDKNIKE